MKRFIKNNIFSAVILLSAIAAVFAGGYIYPYVTAFSSDSEGNLNIVLDPGHGGADGGAISINGTYESDINLSISLKLKYILGLYGINPVMTRETNEINYPDDANTVHEMKVADQKSRVELINSTENAVLISIHQNKYTDSGPSGIQTLYASTDGSMEFGLKMQEVLIAALKPVKERAAAEISGDIYLMKNIHCPAVLIECGFLSNPNDEALLIDSEYQLRTAASIASGFFKSRDELSEIYGGTNEEQNSIFLLSVRK